MEDGLIPDETQYRMREGQISSLGSRLMSSTDKMHQIHITFRTTYRAMMAKRIKILDTKGELTDHQIDDMVKNDPAVIQAQIKKKLLGHTQLVEDVRRLEEKCREIKKLEENVIALVG